MTITAYLLIYLLIINCTIKSFINVKQNYTFKVRLKQVEKSSLRQYYIYINQFEEPKYDEYISKYLRLFSELYCNTRVTYRKLKKWKS